MGSYQEDVQSEVASFSGQEDSGEVAKVRVSMACDSFAGNVCRMSSDEASRCAQPLFCAGREGEREEVTMPLHGHKSDRVQLEDRGERFPIGQSGGGQAKAYDWPSKHRHLSPYSPPLVM